MEDPLLEESLRQHLDLWINTEFEWTEESSLTSSNVNKDETALVTPGGSGTKGKEDDKEMDLLDHLKSRVKGGRERNVLLMSDEKMGGDKTKSVGVDDRVGSKDVNHDAARVASTTTTSEATNTTNVSSAAAGKTSMSSEQEIAPATTTTTASATPDLASFLSRYSALLSSSLPALGEGPLDDPSSGPLGQSQPRVNQDEVNKKNVGASDGMVIKDGRDRSQHQDFTVSHSQSQSQSQQSQQSIRHVPSSEYQPQSKQHDQQQQQQTHDAPTPRHLVPPPAPINTPVVSRAQLNKNNGADKQQQQQQQQAQATTQAQNLMALLTAAFPQYASFEPPMHQNQLGGGYGGGMTTANNHHARANSDGASSTAAFGYHPAAFNGMDFNHHMSGEIDRVFGGAAGIAAAGVEFDGLYKNAPVGVDHGNALQLGPAGGRASTGSASGSLVEASLNSGEYLSAQQHQQFQQQHLGEGGYKKRKLSDDSIADAFESRFGRSPYPMTNASAGNPRKRSSESMEADFNDGPLPDGVTAEEE